MTSAAADRAIWAESVCQIFDTRDTFSFSMETRKISEGLKVVYTRKATRGPGSRTALLPEPIPARKILAWICIHASSETARQGAGARL